MPAPRKTARAASFRLRRNCAESLEEQQKMADTLKREQGLIARYVFCYTTGQKPGQRITESGFNKAWRKARVAACCPGRIPHDFRRTAVRSSCGPPCHRSSSWSCLARTVSQDSR
jgi:hypothetical protein